MQKYDNLAAIKKGIAIATAFKDRQILLTLERICYEATEFAKEKHNFDNQSFNLENSYSFGIFHNGKLIKSETWGAGAGSTHAIEFLQTYAPRRNWEAVVIAGAKYAAELEGYVRHTDGTNSKAGEEIRVLSDAFNFVTLESIIEFKKINK